MKKLVLSTIIGTIISIAALAQDTLVGHITSNRTLVAGTGTTPSTDNIYYLRGYVYVDAGITLTIQPGCVIQGLNYYGTNDGIIRYGTLIISKGATIIANGTNFSPIVFTSNKAPGFRQRGDWGGLVIAGNAPINVTGYNMPLGTNILEGANHPTVVINGASISEPRYEVPYGGSNPLDNSGSLQYVRIEWAGVALFFDEEINGLTLAGVGSGTIIENIQVSHSNDDSFEWFGGTVNCKNLISWKASDDDFDTDQGYSGQCQFGIAFRSCDVADFGMGGRSNGFESDNEYLGGPYFPKTKAKFYNFTVLGPQRTITDVIAVPYTSASAAAFLRRNTEIDIYASVLAGFPNGVSFFDDVTVNNANATFPNNLEIIKSVFAADDVRDLDITAGGIYLSPDANTWFSTRNNGGTFNGNASTLQLRTIGTNCAANNNSGTLKNTFDARPTATGILLTGGLTAAEKTASGALPYIQTVAYRGAFGNINWAASPGFAEYDPQAIVYMPGDITPRSSGDENTEVDNTIEVILYPNPSNSGLFNITFEGQENVMGTISVYDIAGKMLKSTQVSVVAGYNNLDVDASDLDNGIYFVTIQAGSFTKTNQLVLNK